MPDGAPVEGAAELVEGAVPGVGDEVPVHPAMLRTAARASATIRDDSGAIRRGCRPVSTGAL